MVQVQLSIPTTSTYSALGAWNSYLLCHNESLKPLRQELRHYYLSLGDEGWKAQRAEIIAQ